MRAPLALVLALSRATPDEVLAAVDAVARRPDMAAAIRARNGDPENELRAIFGEPLLPPDDDGPGYITLKAGGQ